MPNELQGKRIVVTGANSGIGRAIAMAAGAAGARVGVNFVRSPEDADAVVKAIQAGGGEAIACRADVSDVDQVAQMFQQLDKAWQGVDGLVNNAGIDGHQANTWDADPDAWRKTLEVNLFGAFYCCREALRRMVAQRNGVILNLTSVHEVIAWSGYSAYCASKAALSMLTKTMAQEAAPFGVRVVAIAPGAVKTSINKQVWSNPDSAKDLLTKIPLGRIGEPEEIAQMAVVLLSSKASYVTGTTLFVDGGMTDYPSFQHGG